MRIPTIETDRLFLRSFSPADWLAVHAYAALPEIMEYLPEGMMDESQARAFVEKHTDDNAGAHALVRNSDGNLIGHMVFHPWFGPRTFEIGWVIHLAFQGQGIATEAAWALLHDAFEAKDAHRVIATCQPENIASYRVMERIGMRREAHFRKCIYRGENIWWDEYFYAILREEWTGAG